MDDVPLGRSGLTVSRLGLGLAPIAGMYTPVPEHQARATIERAWHHGIRFFDTAPLYGHGRSEDRAGRALGRHPRSEFVVSTKVGRRLEARPDAEPGIWANPLPGVAPTWDFSYDGVLRTVDESQERLGCERIDVLHLHDPEHHYARAVDGAYRALDLLRSGGEVGAISVGTNRLDRLADFARDGDFDCFMVAGRYTLLDQTALDRVLPMCERHSIGVIAAGVYNSGVLADPRAATRFDYRPANRAVVDRTLAIERVCVRHGVPLRAAATQFPLRHSAVTSMVIGARTPEEVDDAVTALAHDIPGELWDELQREGLVRSGVGEMDDVR